MNQPLISIGIAAHNEQNNIAQIIGDVLAQVQDTWKLKEIMVYCDGCTDTTAELAKGLGNPSVRVSDDGQRRGKTFRVHQMLKDFKGDIVILFDADIRLRGTEIISDLISPMSSDAEVMLTSGNPLPFPPKNFVERMIYTTSQVFVESRLSLRNGHNIFGFLGCCMVIRRMLAEQIVIPEGLYSEDAYIYLLGKSLGYKFRNVPQAVVNYKLASNLTDYLKQLRRSNISIVVGKLRDQFGNLAQEEFYRPQGFYIKAILKQFFTRPLEVICAILVNIYVLAANAFRPKENSPYWPVAESTK